MKPLFDREDWKLTEQDKEAFEEELSNLHTIREENAEYFEALKEETGILSSDIMAILAREYFRAKIVSELPDYIRRVEGGEDVLE